MKYKIAYGRTGLEFELPDSIRADVITSPFLPALENEEGAVRDALQKPLGTAPLKILANKNQKIAIVVNDITRPTPYRKILPPLLSELSDIEDDRITLFVATGTHRPNHPKELEQMLEPEVLTRFRVIQNTAEDPESHRFVGQTSSGNKIFIHKDYLDCGLKILTGFIEPHFFAGFSGGPKACVPGLAGIETILHNHSYANLSHSNAQWAVTWGNPVWEDLHEAAMLGGRPFIVNVALNTNQDITGVFAGDMDTAHEKGYRFVKTSSMVPVAERYDMVISSNAGYPLDLNLYQSVKGISAAAQIVKKTGAVILAADCWDQIPQHGHFGHMLRQSRSPQQVIEKIKNGQLNIQDNWQVYRLCQIVAHNEVYFYSDHLSDEQITDSFLKPCRNIGRTVQQLLLKYGKDPTLCILPEGPLAIPYYEGKPEGSRIE